MLAINHTSAVKSVGSGPARVSTRLAIGLRTHGSILICSPKNRSRLLDTFFRNPCILVPDTETQSSVNGVAQGYIRERERCLWHSLESALVFTRLNAAQRWVGSAPRKGRTDFMADCTGRKGIQTRRSPWTITVGRNGTNIANSSTDHRTIQSVRKGGQMWPFDFKGATFCGW